jgi:hypothetical protein
MGIDGGRSATELLSSAGGRRWGEELGRASLGHYLLRRVVDKRERRRTWARFGQERKR